MIQIYENDSNTRQNKRRLATKTNVMLDLKDELPLLFDAFKEAHELYEHEIRRTPPEARARGFEALSLNSKMIQCVQKRFPNNWKFGKYGRFILRVNSYVILFKKLDKHDRPMNIKTKSVKAISNQLSLPLFNNVDFVEEPILFFGYKKNALGVVSQPKLAYLDEERVEWIVSANDIKIDKPTEQLSVGTQKDPAPKLRKRKAANNKKSSQ